MLNPLGNSSPDNPLLRIPHNLDAEQALLGAILLDNRAYERASEYVSTEDFFDPLHGRIFDAAAHLIQSGRLASPMTMKTDFENYPNIGELTVPQYLGKLVVSATTVSGAKDYAQTIRELADLRKLLLIGQDLATDASSATAQRAATGIIEDTEARLFEVAERSTTRRVGTVSFSDAAQSAINATNLARMIGCSGLSTGIVDLDAKIGGLRRSDLIILAGRPSMGKAQPLSAKVLLRDGTWKPMGELRMGDDLASIDGAPSRVAGVFPQGKKQIYRVTLGDGRTTRACGDHLWLIESSKLSRSKVVSTDTLRSMLAKARYHRRVSLPLVSGRFGSDQGIIVDPWFLGAMIGNGCMTGSHLSISTADAATLFRVQNVVGHDCVSLAGDNGYDYRLRTGTSNTREAMRTLGLYGKGSAEKFIPANYMSASHTVRIELLRGLLDTDGWVEKFGVVRYATSSPQLAADVQALVRSLGGSCTISSKEPFFTNKDGKKCNGLTSYVCNIRHPDRSSLISLKRKQRRCENVARFKSPTIVSIEPDGFEEAQCIRVTHPSSLYVTDDYIVTHNTALATNIAINVAKNGMIDDHGAEKEAPVGFFSLEMSSEQLATRILAAEASLSSAKIMRGQIDEREFRKLSDTANMMSRIPLYIDQTGGITIAQLTARARRAKRQFGIELLVVDYLQLLSGGKSRGDNRVQEITQITVGLKALAKELSIPVIALSQLSRDLEKRENKRPQLSDLRESGSIEQDADVVMFVFREEYYVERLKPDAGQYEKFREWQNQMAACAGKAEVILGKQRHGPVGTVELAFDASVTRFSDLARRDAP